MARPYLLALTTPTGLFSSRQSILPFSPAFEMLRASQTAEPPVHHDGQARAERFALLHAVGDSVSTAGPSLACSGTMLYSTLGISPRSGSPHPARWPECDPGAHLCDVSTTERPSRTTDSKLFQRNRRALGSMPVVGSSCKGYMDSEPGGTAVTKPAHWDFVLSKPEHTSIRPQSA